MYALAGLVVFLVALWLLVAREMREPCPTCASRRTYLVRPWPVLWRCDRCGRSFGSDPRAALHIKPRSTPRKK